MFRKPIDKTKTFSFCTDRLEVVPAKPANGGVSWIEAHKQLMAEVAVRTHTYRLELKSLETKRRAHQRRITKLDELFAASLKEVRV